MEKRSQMQIDYSPQFKQTNNLYKISPNTLHIAVVVDYRLVIRDASTTTITQLYSCIDQLNLLEWSQDSQLVATGSTKLSRIQVFSLNSEWTCSIDQGIVGLTRLMFSSYSLLTWSEYNLRITVWNLSDKGSAVHIQHPKSPKLSAFRGDGVYFALVEQRDGKDFMSIFDTEEFEMVKYFEIATSDCAGLVWDPTGRYIAVWDSSLHVPLH